jgi:hypothetical protein
VTENSPTASVLLAVSTQAFQLWHGELAREMKDENSPLRTLAKGEMPRGTASIYAVACYMAASGKSGTDSFPGERTLEAALGLNRATVRKARKLLASSGWLAITGKQKGPNGESQVYRIAIPADRWQAEWQKYKAQDAEAPKQANTETHPLQAVTQRAQKPTEAPGAPSPPPTKRRPSVVLPAPPPCPECEKGKTEPSMHHRCDLFRDPFAGQTGPWDTD